MMAMAKREQKLRNATCCQRALALPLSSRQEIGRQIRLRVVREFNLPDGVADQLENSSCYCADDDAANMNTAQFSEATQNDMDDDEELPVPSSPPAAQTDPGSAVLSTSFEQNLTFPRHQQHQHQHISSYGQTLGGSSSVAMRRHDLPALITERCVRPTRAQYYYLIGIFPS